MNADELLPPSKTALLVIDMQRDFLAADGYAARAGLDVAGLRRAIEPIRALLQAARAARMLVVHTREGHLPDLSDCSLPKLERSRRAGAEIGSPGPLDRLLIRGEYGHDFIDELKPVADEPVIDKSGYSAFECTKLGAMLPAFGIEQLVITGVTTEVCVSSTLRTAVDRGFRCITVRDACGSSYPVLHDAVMAMAGVEGGIFGMVTTSAEMVRAITVSARIAASA